MSARSTYEATVKAASATQFSSKIMNETVKQTAIDSSKSVAGYSLQSGNFAALDAATKAANIAKAAADYAAESVKQAARDVARDTLRATGDVGPA